MNDLLIHNLRRMKAFCMEFAPGMERDLLAILLISIGIQALSVVYGKFIFRAWPEGEQKNLRYGTICSNGGFLGNPISEGVFGAYGLLLASVFLIPLRIMMWTEGIAIFSGVRDRKSAMKRAATHPCVLACAIGLVLLVTGLRFPAPAMKAISYLGTCNTGLSMLVIGMILSRLHLRDLMDLSAGTYDFLLETQRDYRNLYTMDTMLDEVVADERVMTILREEVPAAYGMGMSGNIESLSMTFRELASAPWFGCPAPMVQKAMERMSEIKAELE